jgi:hypothetical protein
MKGLSTKKKDLFQQNRDLMGQLCEAKVKISDNEQEINRLLAKINEQ